MALEDVPSSVQVADSVPYAVKANHALAADFLEVGQRLASLGTVFAQDGVLSSEDVERWNFETDYLQVALIQLRRRALQELRRVNFAPPSVPVRVEIAEQPF